ncbi:MAG: hypothetical protein ACD_58C00296G0012 [uncultured bacterium]|nr:MAG: hypothetical protein ACD_58C00296G0012 [uncultured bacterium]
MQDHESLDDEQSNYVEIAHQLDELQKTKNDGRGVGCIKHIIQYLEMGKIREAKTICFTDSDKLRSYPDIIDYIKKNLFKHDKEHPWSFLDRLRSMETDFDQN